jgi:hypothetical protein
MSISSALRKLRLQRSSLQYMEEFYRQIDAEQNHRGAAILAAVLVNDALESALCRRLPNPTNYFTRLFDNEGPLSTLDAKILMAQCFGIIGSLTQRNLETVKHVRNTFAHAGVPIDFSTKEIVDACNTLVLPPRPETFREYLPFDTARQKYTSTCETTALSLMNYAAGCGKVRASLMRPDAMVPVTPAPLP